MWQDPTETPDCFTQEDIDALREILRGWTANRQILLDDFVQLEKGGADCFRRATEYIPRVWNVAVGSPVMWNCGDIYTLAHQRFENPLAHGGKRKVVIVKIMEKGFAGATSTRFTGFHYLLVIGAVKGYCVLYDPDVTATVRSKAVWAQFSQGIDGQKPASEEFIQQMILGNGRSLGALVRYYRG